VALSLLFGVGGLPFGLWLWSGQFAHRATRGAAAATAGLWFQALEEAGVERDQGAEPPAGYRGVNAHSWLVAVAMMCLSVLTGCSHAPAADWPDIEKGMMTSDVLAMLGAPQHVQTNGNIEAWKYCRDFFGYFANRSVVIWMDKGYVSSVQYHRNLSDGSCEDFFRTAQ